MEMLLRIFLCLCAILLASANNVIPGHTFPAYQLNGYMNPTVNQPSNIYSYDQGYTTQNQLQQLNISPAAIKQALLTKLLESAGLQPNVNPNAVAYGSNLNGAGYNQIPVNLVNNVPVEYFKSNSNNADIERKSNENGTKSRRGRKKSKPKQKNNSNITHEEDTNKDIPVKSDDANNNVNSAKNNKASRKKSKKQKQDIKLVNESEHIENETKNSTRKRKKKNKDKSVEVTTTTPIADENQVENPKPRRRRKKKKKENENNPTDPEVKTNKQSTEINENVDLDITNEGANNENRRTRNLKQETKEPIKPIPNTPKEITNHFLSNLNQFNNPLMTNWFANFENLYQSMLVTPQPAVTERPKVRKPKKNRNNRRNNIQNKQTIEKPVTVNTTTTTTEVPTTEKIVHEKTEVNFNSNPTEESTKSFELDEMTRKYSSNEIFTDGYSFNDFENYYEGYIADYYPSFLDSAAYNANNKEIILKNLNENKYYYTTDSTEIKNQQKYSEVTEKIQDIYEKNKHTYDEIEKESIRNAYKKDFDDKIEEQLQFRTPPHLTSPDFITRPVDKSQIKPDVYYISNDFDKYEDKSSCYSNSKTPYNAGKCNNIKMQPKDVETVYAKSKVVTYGPVYIPEEDSSVAASNVSPLVSFEGRSHWAVPDVINDNFRAGDTTYVVAKSLDW